MPCRVLRAGQGRTKFFALRTGQGKIFCPELVSGQGRTKIFCPAGRAGQKKVPCDGLCFTSLCIIFLDFK